MFMVSVKFRVRVRVGVWVEVIVRKGLCWG